MKSKSFTITPSSQDNEDNTVVKLIFKAKKNLTKLNKNLSMNKGTRHWEIDYRNLSEFIGGFSDNFR
jgi:hypothetical protein